MVPRGQLLTQHSSRGGNRLGQGGGWSKVTGRVAVGNILGVAEMSTHRKGWEEGRRTPGPQGLSEMESRAVALGRPCCG